MSRVIFNADDFGYSRAINFAIVDTHTMGILTSTTLMTNMPGFEHAIALSKEHPSLGVGIHLTLTCGTPVLTDHKTLTDKSGKFRKLKEYDDGLAFDVEEIYNEWDAQIQRALSHGLKPTHLDSHHHVHTFDRIRDVVIKLATKYELPIRNNFDMPASIKRVRRFETQFDSVGLEPEHRLQSYLNNLLDDIMKYDTVEVMCHPGYLDYSVFQSSSLLTNRTNVAEFLMHSDFSQKLKKSKEIELISYRDL